MKRTVTLLLALCLMLTALPLSALAADPMEAMQVVRTVGIMVGDQSGNMNLDGAVTRAQFAKMLAVAAGQDYAGAGYSPFRDVKHTHWAAGYIKTASDAGWFLGYVDGTFRPENTILYEEGATAVLRMLGYTPEDYPGIYPAAQLIKFENLELGDGVSARRGQTLTRRDCMMIFYNVLNAENKGGKVHAATLGYTLNTSGKIDYQALLLSEAKGPFVADDARWTASLPFSTTGATIYLNGKQVSGFTPAAYDVYYHNAGGAVLWVYTTRAVGIYQAASPAQSAPTGVTVAGKSYTIGDAVAAQKLSSMGQFAYGDAVALLLGMDGKAVDVLPADTVDGLRYGVVTSAAMETYTVGTATRTDFIITLTATDGNSYSYVCDNKNLAAGDLVSAGYENGVPVVRRLNIMGLTGRVNADGTRVGSLTVAAGAAILEMRADGTFATLYPARLAGATLQSGDVRFYTLDAQGAISHLIVDDVTGDHAEYGILTAMSETETEVPHASFGTVEQRSGAYQYIVKGAAKRAAIADNHLSLGNISGPAMFEYTNNVLTDVTLLTKVDIASAGVTAVQGNDGRSYTLADDVQVYIKDKDAYHLSAMTSVTGGEYTLQGYCDSGFSAGGRVRIVIAVAR